ncbi:MAG: acetamidase/formamidase family protein, partial [Halalkalicoccus sp.]|nr:acetamidase/formamidase family protein [Halalkalicoccus sp.]
MPETVIEVDVEAPPDDQPTSVHNRWHPDIPSVVTVDPGDRVRVECLDWTGGQITDDDNANEVRDVDLNQVHYLSGPIEVAGAEPGDLLVMDILDIGALNERWEYGFTGIFSQQNGGGFLTDHFP